MDAATERRARKLFFAYDGSTFYMSRDGVDAEYRALDIPLGTRRQWLKELEDIKLRALAEPGGWGSISFFLHHSLFEHVSAVAEVAPLGLPWERASYVELAWQYTRAAASAKAADSVLLGAVMHAVRERAEGLRNDYTMRGQRPRLEELLARMAREALE